VLGINKEDKRCEIMTWIRGVKIIAIPYKTFKQKIRITKEYSKRYKIEDLGGILYMERK